MAYHLTGGNNLRPYQLKALELALGHSGIVLALPTGTGKTLIGCAWVCELLNRREARRILILEPSRFLVEQTCSYFRECTNIQTGKVYGINPAEERLAVWRNQQYQAIITTAQTALNDYELLDFDAIIVDECHHTTGEHAYNQLLRYDLFKTRFFPRRLGLSATIPEQLRYQAENTIGTIYSWSWTDPDIAPSVPPWHWEVNDAELEDGERWVYDMLVSVRRKSEASERWMISNAIRMLVRDGVLALIDSGQKRGRLGRLMGLSPQPSLGDLLGVNASASKEWHDIADFLRAGRCRPLHKLEQLKRALMEHDYSKAIVFVDRVVIAQVLKEEFAELKPVLLLGRSHGGTETQEWALREARKSDTRLLIATSAAEEGLNVPEVDMVVTWSITANAVRFIQRKGRGMRPSLDGGPSRPKVDVFLATPDTPDYDALYSGIAAVKKAGLDYALAKHASAGLAPEARIGGMN